MIRVLVVDDEVRVANFISKGLREAGYQADIARDAREAQKCVETTEYDIVLLDWLLPDGTGVNICHKWRKNGFLFPVIMITCRDATNDVTSALDTGVDDYLIKPFSFDELLARMRALLRRSSALTAPATLSLDDLRVNTTHRIVTRGETKVYLSEREFTLLEYLLRHAGRAVSKQEILREVWDVQHDIGSNVIEVFINKLRTKLDCGARRPLIHTLRGVGYIMNLLEMHS